MDNIKKSKFDKAKKEMIYAIYDFCAMLDKENINFIENYPQYLPCFQDFLCDISDIEYSTENDYL